jgi:transcriptional regulator with XRE-family HTH domain
MLRQLGAENSISVARISEYETGVREPSLRVLLAYGRVARVHLESLVDDNATLPRKLPGNFIFRRSQQELSAATHSQAALNNSTDNQQ